MMDETVSEILSRHLDGGLGPEEERMLTARLEAEPALAADLEAMRRIRSAVGALAASESTPTELDTLVEPLLRGKPEPLAARPWARWLATAAAVVFGLTVIIEVNRRNPGPSVGSIARMSDKGRTEPTERFSLAPLPTSSLPLEQQPLGASDRLLASPIPEIELEDPLPLEVLGPLEEGEGFEPADETIGGEQVGMVAESAAALADTDELKSRPDQPAAPMAKRDRIQSNTPKKEADARVGGRGAAMQSWEADPPRGRARLFVFINGESAWREFTPSATCKPGRYTVRIVVGGGEVREARPVGGAAAASPSQRLCAAQLVIDLEIEDVADGEYPAEVVVEPLGAGN